MSYSKDFSYLKSKHHTHKKYTHTYPKGSLFVTSSPTNQLCGSVLPLYYLGSLRMSIMCNALCSILSWPFSIIGHNTIGSRAPLAQGEIKINR